MRCLLIISALLLLVGCSQAPTDPRGFSLPLGSVEKGEEVFTWYRCMSCHQLEGFDDTVFEAEIAQKVLLGGERTRVKTYAELLTAVINPSHKLTEGYIKDNVSDNGRSKMEVYNDVMTVTELVDLVAFLQPHYKVKPAQYTHYNQYHIP